MTKTDLELPAYLRALSILLFIVVLGFFLIMGKSLLVPLFLGGFFAILFTPMTNWMDRKKVPKILSTLISLLTMIAVVVALIYFVISTVSSFSKDFDDVSGKMTRYAEQVDEWVENTLGENPQIKDKMNTDYLKEKLSENSQGISNFAIQTVGSLSGIILIPLFMFFFLLYRNHLTRFMVNLYRKYDEELVKERITSFRRLIQNYIIGVVKVMGILAVLNLIALTALGIENAIFFALIAAILHIIPYVGPFIGSLLPIAFAFLTKDSLFYPIAVLASFQLIQFVEGNILTPKIVGSDVNLNAFVTILSLIIGASIWGVAGMILIIPAMAVLREIFELSENTKPFALLMGEERASLKTEEQISNENPEN